MSKRILVTGYSGQLGYDVVKELIKRGHQPIYPTRIEMDLNNTDTISNYIMNCNCEGVIHCAAYTAVDKAEDEIDLCFKINSIATKHIATCCNLLDIPMIYISTDYIFDGNKSGEYVEEDIKKPINTYGKSKALGEEYVIESLSKYYIVRISWVFGKNGKNFIKTMINLSKNNDKLSVVYDQIGSPTYTKDLSRLLVDMIETNKYGIYNATNEGYCSWYEFAKKIFELTGKHIELIPIKGIDFKTKAQRPNNSKLSKLKLINNEFEPLPSWESALFDFLNEINEWNL